MHSERLRQGRLMAALFGADGVPWGRELGQLDEASMRTALNAVGWFMQHYFRMEVHGLERVPAAPVMLVANHSGGNFMPDAWGLMHAWYGTFGIERRLRPLMHEMVFAPGGFFARVGALCADEALARRVLTELRHDLLVMPGGDRDVWRPFRDRYRVQFAGRTGFARLALQARVPIVPVAQAGSHHTMVVLSSGTRLARALGLKRLVRAEILPIHLSAPFGLTFGPLPNVPWPATLRYRFGHPIPPLPGPVTPATIAAHAETVRTAMQELLDELASERRPLRERVANHVLRRPGHHFREQW